MYLAFNESFFRKYPIFTAAGDKCHVVDVKSLTVHYNSTEYMFLVILGHLGSFLIGLTLLHSEWPKLRRSKCNRVKIEFPPKPVLESVASLLHLERLNYAESAIFVSLILSAGFRRIFFKNILYYLQKVH